MTSGFLDLPSSSWFSLGLQQSVQSFYRASSGLFQSHTHTHTQSATYLHSDDGVNEKEHGNQEAHIGQRLEGLDKGPEENPDCVALAEEFYQARGSEETQEAHLHVIFFLSNEWEARFSVRNWPLLWEINSTRPISVHLPRRIPQ